MSYIHENEPGFRLNLMRGQGITIVGETREYDDVYEMYRDVLPPRWCVVKDASGDPRLPKPGLAVYYYNKANSSFKLLFTEFSLMGSVKVYWDEIMERPMVTKEQVEAAVAATHTHTNKTTLDEISKNADDELTFKGQVVGGPLPARFNFKVPALTNTTPYVIKVEVSESMDFTDPILYQSHLDIHDFYFLKDGVFHELDDRQIFAQDFDMSMFVNLSSKQAYKSNVQYYIRWTWGERYAGAINWGVSKAKAYGPDADENTGTVWYIPDPDDTFIGLEIHSFTESIEGDSIILPGEVATFNLAARYRNNNSGNEYFNYVNGTWEIFAEDGVSAADSRITMEVETSDDPDETIGVKLSGETTYNANTYNGILKGYYNGNNASVEVTFATAVPHSIHIEGDNTVEGNSTLTLRAYANYLINDEVITREITDDVEWSVSHYVINGGQYTPPNTGEEYQVVVSADYTLIDTDPAEQLHVDFPVTVTPIMVVEMFLVGADEIFSGYSENYQAFASFTDGDYREVTGAGAWSADGVVTVSGTTVSLAHTHAEFSIITLKFTYRGVEYTKDIALIPLSQVAPEVSLDVYRDGELYNTVFTTYGTVGVDGSITLGEGGVIIGGGTPVRLILNYEAPPYPTLEDQPTTIYLEFASNDEETYTTPATRENNVSNEYLILLPRVSSTLLKIKFQEN